MMAPRVSTQKAKTPTRAEPPINDASHPAPVSAPLSEHTQHMLKALRDHVNKHSTYVVSRFAQEARAMHLGDKPETPIHGESTPDEVRDLIEDGVPVAPLPIIPKDKAN
jgi:hypothetical protein